MPAIVLVLLILVIILANTIKIPREMTVQHHMLTLCGVGPHLPYTQPEWERMHTLLRIAGKEVEP
jgi:hypothetical protein